MVRWLLIACSLAHSTVVDLDEATAYCKGIDLREITIKEVHGYFLSGEMSVEELTECYFGRIRALNPSLNAVISTNPNARKDAIELDLKMKRGEWGSLYGIPILVKDNIAVDGMQTTGGTLFLQDIFPEQEAIAVQRLREHGAIILGKANLSELSGFLAVDTKSGFSTAGGQTRNPYNLTSDIFGSSSGSAAAVAANLAIAALGTETEGSIIAPCSVTGLFCFKPTYDSSLNQGLIPLAKTMDTVGVLARTAIDSAIMAQAIATQPYLERTLLYFKGIRIGILEDYVQPHIKLIENGLLELEAMGVELVRNLTLHIPPDFTCSIQMAMLCEFAPQIQEYLKNGTTHLPSADPSIQNLTSIIQWYRNHSSSKNHTLVMLEAALPESCSNEPSLSLPKHRLAIQHDLTEFFTRYNLHAILVSSHPLVSAFTTANAAGYPIINLPVGFTKDGSSASVAMYGLANSDPLLLKLAVAFDAKSPARLLPKYLN
ncbi:hypothetical protein DSO57_1005810 [Entomophthora muscae]|uniref:Uncharacterized protein n=1 Tax=Entomophthora muscae TaxID=34485 RepID=A0ACC2TJQ5_9FUNG|nr:hypothetical protein DSO57_1005810 [Entomophthora muscae]